MAPGGIAGLALAGRAGAPVATAWLPEGLEREPAFLVYSITKTITATLMLLLCEEGRLTLEDPLSRWAPTVPRSAEMTIRMLLNHTSGVPDYGPLAAYHEAVRTTPGTPWTFEQFAAATYGRGLAFAPGEGWLYSNPGYMLLRRVAERATGAAYAELVRDRIATPLGLTRTFVVESLEQMGELAPAPSRLVDPAVARDVRDVYHPGWVAHGVVASTASETATLLRSILDRTLLSARSVGEMTRGTDVPGAPAGWRRPLYGLGLMGEGDSPPGPLWGHNGGGPGYQASAFVAIAPGGEPLAAAALCASEDGTLAERLVRRALD